MIKKVKIIAEAGVNHNGDLTIAKELIDVAAESGADFVKFQTFKTDLSIAPNAQKADYQNKNTKKKGESQYDMVKKLELSFLQFEELKNYSQKKDISFLSTAFDIPSLLFVNNLIELIKIPSGEITNLPFLKVSAKLQKPLIMSTGMAKMSEIQAALEVLNSEGLDKERITILHCNTEYPTPMEDVNLKAMLHIQRELGVNVGYSDHTLGIEVPIAAVALGAQVIEKHFTLDRALPGPDHSASLEPDELKQMVSAIRNIELALSGDGVKAPSPSEKKNIVIARKSLHYKRDLPKGNIIENEDIIALRPGDGISPMNINDILGKKLLLGIKGGQQISYSDFE